MYAHQWLGDAASDFADAKAKWEAVAGIPYTGTARTAEEMLALYQLDIAIANGSQDAILTAILGPDLQMRGIAKTYGDRINFPGPGGHQMSLWVRWALDGKITPAEYQEITGESLDSNYVYNETRRSQFTAHVYALLGAHNPAGLFLPVRLEGQSDWSVNLTGNYNDGRAYQLIANSNDPDADGKILAWWDGYLASQAPKTVATHAPRTDEPPPEPAGPPAGWRYNGVDGWWGPDGLFYAGGADSTPWDGSVQGVSISTWTQPPAPTPTPTEAPPAGPTVDVPTESGGGTTVDTGGGSPTSKGGPPPDYPPIFPPPGIVPPTRGPTLPPVDGGEPPPVESAPPQQAGFGGTVPLLIAAGVVASLLFTGKKRR